MDNQLYMQSKIDTNDLMNILNGHSAIADTFDKIGDDITNPVLYEYLTELIKIHGYTPVSMIQKANLSKAHAYQILNGTRMPSRNFLVRISFVLGLA
jgi:hypothetical protein